MTSRSDSVDACPTPESETTYLLSATLSEDELDTLRDSAFVYSDGVDSCPHAESTILDTAMIRLDNCTHGVVERGKHRRRVRCAITDRELDAFDAAASTVNPTSLTGVLARLRNAAEPVETLYSVDLYAPLSLTKQFTRHSECGVAEVLSEGSSLAVPRSVDTVDVRTHIRTYLTGEEHATLESLTSDQLGGDEDMASFCNAVAEVAEPFHPLSERLGTIDEFQK